MKCSVCYGTIKNNSVNLLGKDICALCIKCIGESDVDNIFYDFYKDKIKSIIKTRIVSLLPEQP